MPLRLVLPLFCIALMVLAADPALVVATASSQTSLAVTSAPASDSSMFARTILWIFEQQRAFHSELTQALKRLHDGGSLAAGWSLIAASFLYGLFHAAGPGHGKAVVTAYLLTNRQNWTHGVRLAVGAAFCQGATAIILVYGLIKIAGWLPRETTDAVAWSERISYVLISALGLYLAARATWGVIAALQLAFGHGPLAPLQSDVSRSEQNASHVLEDHGCGHAHGPSHEQMERAVGMKASLGVILSVGLRPCTGAILVLVLAHVLGLAWAGITAVVAMSIGTALAIAVLAALVMSAQHWVTSRTAGGKNIWRIAGAVMGFGGGLLLFVMGVTLTIFSFGPAHPLGLR